MIDDQKVDLLIAKEAAEFDSFQGAGGIEDGVANFAKRQPYERM